uniref:sphingosine kinase n=1 Tax=Physcomitrium patens TaxID=3218 RepID=A0A7I4FBM7_PHYPA
MEEVLNEQVVLDGKRVLVTLDSAAGVLQWRGERDGQLILQNDLIGFCSSESGICLYTFRMTKSSSYCGKGLPGRKRKDMVVEFSNDGARRLWCDSLQRILDKAGRPKRLLVLVNPFGGRKTGRKVFSASVEPLLKAAGITYTVKETQFQRHALDLAKESDLSQLDGIVCVSGDGVLVEVLNGLLERSDWERAIKMPIGIIPAGTGNGLAKSVLDHVGEPCDAASATFLVIRGQTQPLDVATAKQSNVKFHSILMLTWGLVADVDIESERLRWMGALRLDVYTLIRISNLRKYNGQLYYIPAPGYEGTGTPLNEEFARTTLMTSGEANSDSSLQKHGDPGSLQKNFSEWREMEGPFILIWLNNVPFVSESVNAAPNAKFADGYLDLIILKDCPRWALLNLLLKVQTGGHIKSKYVDYLKL